jgi:hypothetical protein
MVRHDPSVSLEDLQCEFREHSVMRPRGDLLQVSEGKWLFRSASIREFQVELPAVDVSAPRFETMDRDAHRGSIEVDGTPGRGSTFRFRMPRQVVTSAGAQDNGATSSEPHVNSMRSM